MGMLMSCPICSGHFDTATESTTPVTTSVNFKTPNNHLDKLLENDRPFNFPSGDNVTEFAEIYYGNSAGGDYQGRGGNVYAWNCRVAGISHRNKNGVSRQDIAKACAVGEHVRLFLEVNNPVEPDATMSCRSKREQLGYFPSSTGKKVRKNIELGYLFDIYISAITGGTSDRPTSGLLLLVFQFHCDEVTAANSFIDRELRNEGITPLYRPSDDLLTRTRIERIRT